MAAAVVRDRPNRRAMAASRRIWARPSGTGRSRVGLSGSPPSFRAERETRWGVSAIGGVLLGRAAPALEVDAAQHEEHGEDAAADDGGVGQIEDRVVHPVRAEDADPV